MNVTLFSSRTTKGKELNAMLEESIPQIVSSIAGETEGGGIQIKSIFPGDPEFGELFFHIYQHKSDLVIFDASIEEEDGCVLGENYNCAFFATLMKENVLVVSRTMLPLNFIPYTDATNVLPLGEDYRKEGDTIRPIRSYDNSKDVLPWVESKLKDIYNKDKKKRSQTGFSNRTPNILVQDGRHVAFISYRSYYNEPNKCGNYSVQDLERFILAYHKEKAAEEDWRVLFFPPGSLSQDCPTEDLRWALMTRLENIFKYVEEVWVFGSGPEDEYSYWDSWFTQGEFLSLMNINQRLPDSMPAVFIFDPHDGSFRQVDTLPHICNSLSKELALFSANSDTLWGDRTTLKKIIWYQEHNGIGTRLLFRLSGNKDKHAYSHSFLTGRVFSCPCCQRTGYSMDSFSNDEFIRDFMTIGNNSSSLAEYNHQRGYFIVEPDEFKECIRKGFVECPNCHSRIGIKHAPDQSFYLWQRFLPNYPYENVRIEKIEAYNIIPDKNDPQDTIHKTLM